MELEYHPNADKIKELFDFSKVPCLADFHDEVENICKTKTKRITELYIGDTKPLNKFRGDVEEIYVYFLIMRNLDVFGLKNVRFLDHEMEEEDVGVDMFAITSNGEPATIQVKYIGDPNTLIKWNDKRFGNFCDQSLSREDEGGFGVRTKRNMYFLAQHGKLERIVRERFTGVGGKWMNQKYLEELIPGLRERSFWEALQEYNNAYELLDKESLPPLREHQIEIKKKLINFIESESERGYISAPTGSGKTRSEIELILDCFNKYDDVVTIIMSPRIKLSGQLKRSIYSGIENALCSFYSKKDDLKLDEDDKINSICNHVFNEEGIKSFLEKYKRGVIVTTYHSLYNRLGEYINNYKGNKKVILIEDECHNSVINRRFSKINTKEKEIVKFDKLIGFTATVVNTSNRCTDGMNHPETWGKLIHKISYREMFRKGYIVPPTWKSIQETEKDMNIRPARLVEKSLNEAYDFCKNTNLQCKILVKCESRKEANDLWTTFKVKKGYENWNFYKAFTGDETYPCFNPHGQIEKFKRSYGDMLKNSKVLFYVDMISEGIDIPDCSVLILLKESINMVELIQAIGRVLRVLPSEREKERDQRNKREGLIILPEENEENDSTGFNRIREVIKEIRNENDVNEENKNDVTESEKKTKKNENIQNKYVDSICIDQIEDAKISDEGFNIDVYNMCLDKEEENKRLKENVKVQVDEVLNKAQIDVLNVFKKLQI